MADLNDMRIACENCSRCENCSTTKYFSSGSGKNGIMIVTEKPLPGREKAALFSVHDGTMLKRLLTLFDVRLSDCYVTSVQKCVGMEFSSASAKNCLTYLRSQFRELRPHTIICLGENAAKLLIGDTFSLDNDHGRVTVKGSVNFAGTFSVEEAASDIIKKEAFLADLTNIFQNTTINDQAIHP